VEVATLKKMAFKVGFLTKLAEAGLTPHDLQEKLAAKGDSPSDPTQLLYDVAKGGLGEVASVGRQGVGAATSAASNLPSLAAYGLTGLPVAIGGGLGALEQLTQAPTSLDTELIRKAEQIGLYKQLAREIHERRRARGAV
jgi:hypothetical protein